MSTVPPTAIPNVINEAIKALKPFAPADREQAENMLLFWRRRAELTPETTEQVLDRLFPADDAPDMENPDVREGYVAGYLDAIAVATRLYAEKRDQGDKGVHRADAPGEGEKGYAFVRTPASKLIDPPACPSWCDGVHLSEQDSDEFRDCTSEEVFVPVRRAGERGCEVFQINAVRTFNKIVGKLSRPMIQMEDYDLLPREARALARELIHAADLIDG
ncbi:DUF6907 domain-containing protein [Actinoplanes teichomyceticus]|uniref:Uncharacterized protein n=1 Tax=Actinoplanes teichomyceticus TaxID=1867 RepID=A0A561WI98_ACTTI|nr:hypothetical protein [Actinoplanes teichomyceticus]TWG23599.1 hypothetical protein FHX34_102148 [Actinoplanes teichomyceticus]GIF11637.1 hypothetical protein Ate01nite_16690 [Actinoplanes teichomyceticus]